MKHVQFLPRVQFQIDEAAEWYNAQRGALGNELLTELASYFQKISDFPRQYAVVDSDFSVRKAGMNRFPYAIYFVEKPTYVEVIGIIHAQRSPEHWKRFLR